MRILSPAAVRGACALVMLAAAPAAAQTAARPLRTTVDPAPGPAKQVARVRIHGRIPSALKLVAPHGASAPAALARDGDTEVDVAVGTQLMVHPEVADAPVALRTTSKQSLPGTILVGASNAETGGATVWTFQPVVLAKIVPLQWDANAKSYLTVIEVGIDSDKPDARLLSPVTFEILGEHVERISPDRVTITAPGPAGYTSAKILTTRYVPSVKISVHSPAGDAAFEANVDPGIARSLIPTQLRIPAFGLGATVITLSCSKADGSDGSALPGCAGHYIPTTSHGRIEPTDIELKAGAGAAHVTLYSGSSGTAVVTVGALPPLHIELVWPWSLFIAGLAGAVLGALLRVFTRNQKDGRSMVIGTLIGSIVTGAIIDVLLTIGVPLVHSLQQGLMTTEAGWLAIGTLGGLLGTPALVGIAQKLLGGGADDEPAPASAGPHSAPAAPKAAE